MADFKSQLREHILERTYVIDSSREGQHGGYYTWMQVAGLLEYGSGDEWYRVHGLNGNYALFQLKDIQSTKLNSDGELVIFLKIWKGEVMDRYTLVKHLADLDERLAEQDRTIDVQATRIREMATELVRLSNLAYDRQVTIQLQKTNLDEFTEQVRCVKHVLGERYTPGIELGDLVGDVVRDLAELQHAVWHMLDDCEERPESGEYVLDKGSYERLSALVPVDHPVGNQEEIQ